MLWSDETKNAFGAFFLLELRPWASTEDASAV